MSESLFEKSLRVVKERQEHEKAGQQRDGHTGTDRLALVCCAVLVLSAVLFPLLSHH